jgi:hypothetical protein
MHLPRPLALALAALLLAPALAAQSHHLNLTPPWKPGQLYSADITAIQDSRTALTNGETILHEQTIRSVTRLRAEGEALEVFENGGLKKTRYTVGSLRRASDGKPEADYLPPGTEVLVERVPGADETFHISGQPATPEQKGVLASIFSTDDTNHNDQIIFGPKKPVSVGESWPVDAAAFASAMESSLGKLGEASGSMKLDGFEKKEPADVASLSGHLTVQLLAMPLPPEVVFKSGKAHFVLEGRIPMSRAGTEHLQNLKGTVELLAEAPQGPGAVITLRLRHEHEQRSVLRFR